MLRAALALSTALLAAPVAQAQDWTGPYIGLGASRATGEQVAGGSFPLDGNPVSLYGGYNWQNGNFVFGGELAVSNNAISLTTFPGVDYNRVIDLKARVGVASGRALFYGVVGLSRATYVSGAFKDNLDGMAYGIGADVLVSDKVFVGAEYLRRDLDHSTPPGVTSSIDTFTLRVGIKF